MPGGDTIVALSTGPLPSGVAVVRVSGPASRALVEALAGSVPPARRLVLRSIRAAGGGLIDRGMLAWFPGPHSFTGEDSAEFHVHGSPAVVKALLRALTASGGARLALAGEFTRRAFDNGRLDWLEVEGLADLLDAETESQRALAVARADGALSARIAGWRQAILDLRAAIEAQLDFADEGDVGALPADFAVSVAQLSVSLREAAAAGDRGRLIREGFRVALGGLPNAGKSSLLNALAHSEVAIVTDEAGTTRDVRDVRIDLDGRLVVMVDMAGLRDTASKAEAEGVRRARAELQAADLVLWLQAPDVPGGEPPAGLAGPVWRIGTKGDLGTVANVDLCLSVRTGDNVEELVRRIGAVVDARTSGGETALVSHERDREALLACAEALQAALQPDLPLELVAEQLRLASFVLERLIGGVDAEAVLGALFSRFCIGK